MNTEILKVRCGKVIFTRANETQDWHRDELRSISQAKKKNGLKSMAVKFEKDLPAKVRA